MIWVIRDKNIPNASNQVITIGPENPPDPFVRSLLFSDQFIVEVMSFDHQALDFRFHERNPRCQGPFRGGVPIRGLVQTRWGLWYAARIGLMDFAKEGPEPTQEVGGFREQERNGTCWVAPAPSGRWGRTSRKATGLPDVVSMSAVRSSLEFEIVSGGSAARLNCWTVQTPATCTSPGSQQRLPVPVLCSECRSSPGNAFEWSRKHTCLTK